MADNKQAPPKQAPPPPAVPTEQPEEEQKSRTIELKWTQADLKKGLPTLSEAPLSVYGIIRSENGWLSVTARGIEPDEVRGRFKKVIDGLSNDFNMSLEYNPIPPTATISKPPSAHPPVPPPTAPQATAQPQAQTQPNGDDRGVGELHEISIETYKGSLRTKFLVGRFNYPFSDARDPQTIAALFEKDLGWTANHFAVPTYYGEDVCAGLFVEWERVNKKGTNYYNVLRVFRTDEEVPF